MTLNPSEQPSEASASSPLEAAALIEQLGQARAEVSRLRAQLELMREQDPLTGLPNRIRLADRTGQAVLMARRLGSLVAILFIDLDRFKGLAQSLPFAAADDLLLQLARRLTALLAPCDTLARVGTDQFAVLLPEVSDPFAPIRTAQSLLDAVRIPFRLGLREVRLTASIGISVSPQDGDDATSLQKEAENAAARAKGAGGDAIQCTTLTLSEAAFERQQMEALLGEAVRRQQLQILYQPQCAADGSIFGMEALLRWNHPVLGPVPPAKFVPVAEETQIIHAMGEWTLAAACRQAAIWQLLSPRPLRLAVNVSPVQLQHPQWVDLVARTLREARLPPACLELEITEGLLLKNPRSSQIMLTELRGLGVRFGIDDFGTGYSSLGYLQRLPIDSLKIDQVFVRGMFPSQPGVVSSIPIVQTIIGLARNMDMRVVAEGVESEDQLEALVRLGCDGFQGFLLGRPMAAEELGRRLELQADSAFDALLPPPLGIAN